MLCRITPTRQDWVPDRNESPSTVHHTQGISTANVSLFLPYHFSFFTNVLTEAIKVLFTGREGEGGNLAASKIRNLECPNYEICLIDYGCGKFNRKIHIMEQYP